MVTIALTLVWIEKFCGVVRESNGNEENLSNNEIINSFSRCYPDRILLAMI